MKPSVILFLSTLLAVLAGCALATDVPAVPEDPALSWGVPEGYAVEKVADGFQYLTNIVFVPEPGPNPDDVRFFATELYGRVLAVRNDGRVEEFFNIPSLNSPEVFAEYGVHGLCLLPEHGTIYLTWSEPGRPGFARSHLYILQSVPGVFGPRAERWEEIGAELFDAVETNTNHQIGPCQVLGDVLIIGMGEGGKNDGSQDPTNIYGKILRFDLDLQPASGNPYPPNADPDDDSEFVWASGFRNPYALYALTPEDIYVGDNGYKADRFVYAQPGMNYGWDGTDDFFPVASLSVFTPSIAPTRLAFVPPGHPAFDPDFPGGFLLAAIGNLYYAARAEPDVSPSIFHLPVDTESASLAGQQETFVSYRGPLQGLVAMALGPDGLYFSPFLPESESGSAIYRLAYDPEHAHPTRVGEVPVTADKVLITEGCTGCHTTFGKESRIGPSLDPAYLSDRLRARLNSPEYLAVLDAVDEETDSFFQESRPQRDAVRASSGDARLAVWLEAHLTVTGFDNPASIMPRPALTTRELEVLRDYLLTEPSLIAYIKRQVLFVYPVPEHRHLLYMLLLGITIGWAGSRLWTLIRKNTR